MRSWPIFNLMIGIITVSSSFPARASAEIRFTAPYLPTEVNYGAEGIASGDLDRDGYVDVVVTSPPNHALSVFKGLGDGRFATPVHYQTGPGPRTVLIGLFDGDENPDVICTVDRSISFLRGLGAAGLAPEVVAAPIGSTKVVAADIDADGVLDLVAGSAVLLGRGDGTFDILPPVMDFGFATQILAHDFDADGHVDVIASLGHLGVEMALGQGNGSFASPVRIMESAAAWGIASANLDLDELVDLLVLTPSTITRWRNLGDGSFESLGSFPAGFATRAIRLHDLNGDQLVDLIATQGDQENGPTAAVQVWLGRGANGFGDGAPYPTGSEPGPMLIADFLEDGHEDILTLNFGAGTLAVLPGLGDGRFGDPTQFPAGRSPRDPVLADFDRDGRMDVAVANRSTSRISILHGVGAGTLATPDTISVGYPVVSVTGADLDHEGTVDLVAIRGRGGPVEPDATILLNDAHGGFFPYSEYPMGDTTENVLLVDLDLDHQLDLVSFGGQYLATRFGGLGGSFSAPLGYLQPDSNGGALAVGDLNGDGFPDVVSAGSNSIDTRLGVGDGTFGPAASRLIEITIEDALLADLNDDNRADLLVAEPSIRKVTVFMSLPEGGFDTGRSILTGDGPVDLALVDLDADGLRDLVVVNSSADHVAILPGQMGGHFGAPIRFGVGKRPSSVALGDMNADGRMDLVVANSTSGAVSVLLNRSGRTPIVIEDLTATRRDEIVELSWRARDVQLLESIRVERSSNSEGPFRVLAESALDPRETMNFIDLNATENEPWYRLGLVHLDGNTTFTAAALAAQPGAVLDTASLDVVVDPGDGSIRIDYTVGRSHRQATLAAFDVRGRQLWSAMRSVEPGLQREIWDRRDPTGARIGRGIYFVRLDSVDGLTLTRRLVLLRP